MGRYTPGVKTDSLFEAMRQVLALLGPQLVRQDDLQPLRSTLQRMDKTLQRLEARMGGKGSADVKPKAASRPASLRSRARARWSSTSSASSRRAWRCSARRRV